MKEQNHNEFVWETLCDKISLLIVFSSSFFPSYHIFNILFCPANLSNQFFAKLLEFFDNDNKPCSDPDKAHNTLLNFLSPIFTLYLSSILALESYLNWRLLHILLDTEKSQLNIRISLILCKSPV